MSSAKETIQDVIKNIDTELFYTKQMIEHTVAHGENAFDGKFEEHCEAWYDYLKSLEQSTHEMRMQMNRRFGLRLALKAIEASEKGSEK